jgi:outer membrane cobalamin receptor
MGSAAILSVLGTPDVSSAQQLDSTALEMDEISLEELLQTELTVATGKGTSLSVRESPGVVTLVTREEIQNSGARDLHDVLHMVLGFQLAADTQGTTGYGIRGTWAQEGKVLLLVDGVQMNELLYGNPITGNQMFVDHIEFIEVMRGPGSALYGGFAELAVVNIITRGAHDLEGASASVTYGRMQSTNGRESVSLNVGKTLHNGLAVSLTSAVGQGHRSDEPFREPNGQDFPSQDYYGLDGYYVNLGVTYQELTLRILANRYDLESSIPLNIQDAPEPIVTEFESRTIDAKYRYRPVPQITILPRLTLTQLGSWRTDGTYERKQSWYYEMNTSRLLANLAVSYDPSPVLNLVAGGEVYQDRGQIPDDKDRFDYNNFGMDGGKPILSVTHTNLSAYTQALVRSSIATLTLGARFDDHSAFGNVFVPRMGITKIIDHLHLKLLAGRAYRAPTIENLRTLSTIKPEKTRSLELEAGYQISSGMNVVANAFDILIEDVIVWDNVNYAYQQYPSTGTRGLEAEFRIREPWGYLTVGYTYARAKQDKDKPIPQYAAKDDNGTPVSEVNFGFPAHKATLNASVSVFGGLTINPSAVFLSRRYSQAVADTPAPTDAYVARVPKEFEPTWLLNLHLLYRDLGLKGLDVGVGVFDILSANYQYLPGYDNLDGASPGPSRELVARVSFHQPF